MSKTNQIKQTKIIATVGPASAEIIDQLIENGVDVFRINFSHGTRESHQNIIQSIRDQSAKLGRTIAIMGDLQGPKIRVAKFANSSIELQNSQEFVLDCAYDDLGNEQMVGVDYKDLAHDVKKGDDLLLDDGKIALQVSKVEGSKIYCIVTQGGELKNNKGINKVGGGLTAPALTTKDFADLEFACNANLDYIAVSFVRDKTDIALARTLIATHENKKLRVIAKIERTEAIKHMDEIIAAADGIMVARGDLAVEVGEASVPSLQKKLIKVARQKYKLTIVATQMLESMIINPVATRAEISDIANAVLDGTDAVMLSAETASGKYPIAAVSTMARACLDVEKHLDITLELDLLGQKFKQIDQAIAMSALSSAYHLGAKAIVSLTTSGATALWLSRFNSGIPVYAITGSQRSANLMALYRDVHPMIMPSEMSDVDDTNSLLLHAKDFLLQRKVVAHGDVILVTMGDQLYKVGGSNTMKIITC